MTPDAFTDLVLGWVIAGLFLILMIGIGLGLVWTVIRAIWEG